MESSQSNSDLPPRQMISKSLNDRDHNTAITMLTAVTMVAERLRDTLNSSSTNAVLTSWMEISDVRAASDSRI